MKAKFWIYRFWHFIWFIALPLAIAWVTIYLLNITGKIQEVEVWYVLLLFAVLVFGMSMLREKLPFWRDLDKNSPYQKHRRRSDAKKFARVQQKLLKKNAKRVGQKGQAEVQAAIDELLKQVKGNNDDHLAKAQKKLEEKAKRHLAFAQKSAGREYFESISMAIIVALILRLFVVEAFKIPSESMVPTLMVGDHIFVSKYRYGLSIPFSNKRLVRFANPAHGEVVVFVKPSGDPQGFLGPARSQIYPDDNQMAGKDFIKRIIGLPGDTVKIQNGVLYVNDKEIPRCKVGSQTYRTRNMFKGTWEDDQADLWIEKHGDFRYTIIKKIQHETERMPTLDALRLAQSGKMDGDFESRTVPEDHIFVLGDNRDNSNDSRYWGVVPFDNIKGRAMFIWWSNRRPYGFQWDRVGTLIMNEPDMSEEQNAALARCPNMR